MSPSRLAPHTTPRHVLQLRVCSFVGLVLGFVSVFHLNVSVLLDHNTPMLQNFKSSGFYGKALLVRATPNGLTEPSISRMLDWSRSLIVQGVDCHVSLDLTFPSSSKAWQSRSRRLEASGWILHTFSEHDLLQAFAGLHQVKTKLTSTFKKPVGGKLGTLHATSLGWCCHNQPIILWWRFVRRTYQSVWVLESDVGFSGNISKLFSAFAETGGDLVACGLKQRKPDWVRYRVTTERFAKRFPVRWFVKEHALLMSERLLETMEEASMRDEMGYSEMTLPTLVLGSNGTLIFKSLCDFVGSSYGWDQQISEDEWHIIITSQNPLLQNKLWHALKY